MKIGILGGTFNPVHNGHLRAAEEVQELFQFDRLFFIPSGMPPFKKSKLADARHRYKMTALAIRDNKSFEVSDFEIKSKGVSYSLETLVYLATKYKKSELYFIIGIDAFLDLPKWRQPMRLMELTNFVIISRPGFCFADIQRSPFFPIIRKMVLRDFDRSDRRRLVLRLSSGKKAFLCKITGFDISASRIRNLVRKGKNIKYLLPESVESYIISHKLYK
jgi:nicotinate-nucleotide adenylyltransferase